MTETILWQQRYVQGDDQSAIAATITGCLAKQGYQPYDPFPGGTGTPPGYKLFVRLFVAPPVQGWIAILGSPAPDVTADLNAALSADRTLIEAILTDRAVLNAYRQGAIDPSALAALLPSGKSLDDLSRAMQNTPEQSGRKKGKESGSALPGDLEKLARDHNVNPDQAGKLMDRLSSSIFGRLSKQSSGEAGSMRGQAQAMLGAGKVDWNSPAARSLEAQVRMLQLPFDWRNPSFEVVRDAYQVARRLQRSKSAQLMQDERDALNTVPNAGEYVPVYAGK